MGTRDRRSQSGRNTCRRRRQRRGSALVMVLGLVAITLAVSYSMMRTQGVSSQISANQDRRGDARQAALTGLWVGFRKIHEDDWGGAGTYELAWLSDTEAYIIYYMLGDESLAVGDPDYDKYAFRLTIYSQGYCLDPENAGIVSTHTMSSVVQLLPTNLGSQPNKWSTMQQYTLFQTHQERFNLNPPYRIEGPVRAQYQLRIAEDCPDDDDARERFFSDLRSMQLVGKNDDRPFTGPVDLDVYSQYSDDYYDLILRLGVSVNHTSPSTMGSDWGMPSSVSSYRLYPGGPLYYVQTVSNLLSNVTLEADPLTNPLGIFYYGGNLTVGDNVTVHGTLIAKYDLIISGKNVNIEAIDMPGLHSGGGTLQLPAVCCDDFFVEDGATATIKGMMASFDEYEINYGSAATSFVVEGRVASKKFDIEQRSSWDSLNWSYRHSQFLWQYVLGMKYFPEWLKKYHGLDHKAKIVFRPEEDEVTYDWFSFGSSTSILARDASDGLLHWEILSWEESP